MKKNQDFSSQRGVIIDLFEMYNELIRSDWLVRPEPVANQARSILECLYHCILSDHNIEIPANSSLQLLNNLYNKHLKKSTQIPKNVQTAFGTVWKMGNDHSHYNYEKISLQEARTILNQLFTCLKWYANQKKYAIDMIAPNQWDNFIAYELLLKRCLDDRVLSLDEARILADFRRSHDLHMPSIEDLHKQYTMDDAIRSGLRYLLESEERQHKHAQFILQFNHTITLTEKAQHYLDLTGIPKSVAEQVFADVSLIILEGAKQRKIRILRIVIIILTFLLLLVLGMFLFEKNLEAPSYTEKQGPGVDCSITTLSSLSAEELRITRNTVYAQYGRKFVSDDLNSYFSNQEWYKINPGYHDQLLQEDDLACVAKILLLEQKKHGKITEQNWRQHPQILEIKKIVKNITVRKKEYPVGLSTYDFTACEANLIHRLTLFVEEDVQYFQLDEVTTGIQKKSTYHYDRSGTLRYIHEEYNRINEQEVYIKDIYFDRTGKEIFVYEGAKDIANTNVQISNSVRLDMYLLIEEFKMNASDAQSFDEGTYSSAKRVQKKSEELIQDCTE